MSNETRWAELPEVPGREEHRRTWTLSRVTFSSKLRRDHQAGLNDGTEGHPRRHLPAVHKIIHVLYCLVLKCIVCDTSLVTFQLHFAFFFCTCYTQSSSVANQGVIPQFWGLRRYCHTWHHRQLWPLDQVLFCLIYSITHPTCLVFPLMMLRWLNSVLFLLKFTFIFLDRHILVQSPSLERTQHYRLVGRLRLFASI